MTLFYKCLLFISSYAPLYILLAIYNYDFNLTPVKYINKISCNKPMLYFWLVIIILILISVIAVAYFKFISLNDRKSFSGLKQINESVLSYLITYVVPLTTMDINSINSIIVNGFLFIIIGVVYVNSDLIYLNIMLIFMGYRVYRDLSDNIIISNYSSNELTAITNNSETVLCRRIVKGVYLVRKTN